MRALRFVGWFLGGGLGVIVLHAALVWSWHPVDPAADTAAPATLARTPSVPGEALLLFAGDTAEADAALPTLAERGLMYPFGDTADLVSGADLAVFNAEAPITDGGTRFPIYKDYVYRAPAASARALAAAGFDVADLANNHALDYGGDGLGDTIANLGRAGIATIGGGRDAAQARRGLVVDIGGLRVGLLAYCERQFLWDVYVDQFARAGHPGVAMAVEPDLDRDVARLRARADLVVVQLHIGDNYAPPRAVTLRWARRAIDAGADLVVCHHPHVAHPLARWRGKPILLSLGNYAFGTPGRATLDYGQLALVHARRCRRGAVFDRVEIVPLAVQNQRVRFRPTPLRDAELAGYLERLAAESRSFGAEVRAEAGRGVLHLPGCEAAP